MVISTAASLKREVKWSIPVKSERVKAEKRVFGLKTGIGCLLCGEVS